MGKIIAFMLGLAIGAFAGFIVAALCAAAGRTAWEQDRMSREDAG